MKQVVYILQVIGVALAAVAFGYMLGLIVAGSASAMEPSPESKPAPNLVKIAVVDSGVNIVPQNLHLCETGHKDFTGTSLKDDLGHGTPITSIIASHLPESGACIIVIKVFTRHKQNHMLSVLEGLRYVTTLKDVQYVNLSLSGMKPSLLEELYVLRMLTQGKKVLAAAGNEGLSFSKIGCVIYPACYDKRIIVVGDILRRFNRGYGVDIYDHGAKQLAAGQIIEGTSPATAHATGKLVRKAVKSRRAK
jgi:subtilisin family serine protease